MSLPLIRAATEADLDAVADVIDAAYAPWRDRIADLPDVSDGLDREVAEGRAHVATEEDRVVGVLIAGPHGPAFHIVNVAVHPDAAGRGLARAMLAHGEALARSLGLDRMMLATHPKMAGNEAMYEHLGWIVSERSEAKIVMERTLDP